MLCPPARPPRPPDPEAILWFRHCRRTFLGPFQYHQIRKTSIEPQRGFAQSVGSASETGETQNGCGSSPAPFSATNCGPAALQPRAPPRPWHDRGGSFPWGVAGHAWPMKGAVFTPPGDAPCWPQGVSDGASFCCPIFLKCICGPYCLGHFSRMHLWGKFRFWGLIGSHDPLPSPPRCHCIFSDLNRF